MGQFFKGGEIVGLVGELGSGKTCFVRGMSQGLDVAPDAWIRSPSFTLINEYHGRLAIYHIDLYRIERAAEMEELNLREYLFSEGVSVIEWFDRLPQGEAEEYLKIEFAPVDRSRRRLTFTARGAQYKKILGDLKKGSPAATKVKG